VHQRLAERQRIGIAGMAGAASGAQAKDDRLGPRRQCGLAQAQSSGARLGGHLFSAITRLRACPGACRM
jgi:hypothetical protein